jgi:hypothetical protein
MAAVRREQRPRHGDRRPDVVVDEIDDDQMEAR